MAWTTHYTPDASTGECRFISPGTRGWQCQGVGSEGHWLAEESAEGRGDWDSVCRRTDAKTIGEGKLSKQPHKDFPRCQPRIPAWQLRGGAGGGCCARGRRVLHKGGSLGPRYPKPCRALKNAALGPAKRAWASESKLGSKACWADRGSRMATCLDLGQRVVFTSRFAMAGLLRQVLRKLFIKDAALGQLHPGEATVVAEDMNGRRGTVGSSATHTSSMNCRASAVEYDAQCDI